MQDIKITKIVNMKIFKGFKGSNDVQVAYQGIHFTINQESYFLHISADYTLVTHLYKGRCRGQLEKISSCFGMNYDLIKFTRKPGCLKYIDINHFINELVRMGLLVKEDLL